MHSPQKIWRLTNFLLIHVLMSLSFQFSTKQKQRHPATALQQLHLLKRNQRRISGDPTSYNRDTPHRMHRCRWLPLWRLQLSLFQPVSDSPRPTTCPFYSPGLSQQSLRPCPKWPAFWTHPHLQISKVLSRWLWSRVRKGKMQVKEKSRQINQRRWITICRLGWISRNWKPEPPSLPWWHYENHL